MPPAPPPTPLRSPGWVISFSRRWRTGASHVWHLYVIRTSDAAGLQAFLAEHGVACGRHYPEAPHRSGAYAHLGLGEGAFPVAEAIAHECLSLPIFPGITDAEQACVVDAIREWFARG